jgi:hypothetical protein
MRLIHKRVAYGKKTSVRQSWSAKADFAEHDPDGTLDTNPMTTNPVTNKPGDPVTTKPGDRQDVP